jgi:hypothetical protein
MKSRLNTNALFPHRAILVLGALLCLCISDSAGPRLFPLPTAGTNPEVSESSLQGCAYASRTPDQNREPNAYLQMVAASQYRARDCHHHGQQATHAPHGFCQPQLSSLTTTPDTYAPLNFKTKFHSIPTGRGPPRFHL